MKSLLFLSIIFSSLIANAQFTGIVGADNGTNGLYDYPCPIQDYYHSTRAQYLYTASELNAIGLMQGAVITEIGWVVDSTFTSNHLIQNYSISLLNSSLSSLVGPWVSGMIQVYGPQDYSYPSGYAGNLVFPVTPFYYTGGNLIVEVCGGFPTAPFSVNPLCHWTTGLPFNASHQWVDDLTIGCGNGTSTNSAIQSNRPVMLVTYTQTNLNIAENSLSGRGYIYPNPVTDQAWVYLHDQAQEKHLITVHNSIGKKLLSATFTGNQYLLKENLPPGIYMVSVSDVEGRLIYASRFVKE